jgi:hypothetical protein
MQYLHLGSLRKYACGVYGFLYEDPTLNAIPAFGVTPNSYPVHFPTLISITLTLVPYLLSPTDTTTLIPSYPTDLAIVLTTYPTNLATLLMKRGLAKMWWAISSTIN